MFDACQALVKSVHSRFDGSVVVSIDAEILFVPTRAKAQDEPTSADMVDRSCHVSDKIGVAVRNPGDEQPDLGSAGDLAP